jgi:hypothetical protein
MASWARERVFVTHACAYSKPLAYYHVPGRPRCKHACPLLLTCLLQTDSFVGLLLWSSVSLACEGSLLANLVKCSFQMYRT